MGVTILDENSSAITEKTAVFSAYGLKLIALATMLLDHTGVIILGRCLLSPTVYAEIGSPPSLLILYAILRVIGRLSYPIFSFLLVEGFLKTKSVGKYLLRLGIFAIISEIPFDFSVFGVPLEFSYQNNIITLFISLLMLICMKKTGDKWYFSIPIAVAAAGLTELLHTDYAITIPALVAAFYIFRNVDLYKSVACCAIIVANSFQSYPPYCTVAGLLSLCLIIFGYNGTQGKKLGIKAYAFYPVHLAILGIIAFLILYFR